MAERVIGDGRQWVSWISRTDVIHALAWVSLHESLSGPLLVSSPTPVRNEEFMRTLAQADAPADACAGVPEFAVKMMFGEMGEETVLSGQKVVPRQLHRFGLPVRSPDPRTGARVRDEDRLTMPESVGFVAATLRKTL